MNEHVVLVHGLWMHGALMRWMGRRLARAGYTVHCYTYPSVRMSMAENARRLAAFWLSRSTVLLRGSPMAQAQVCWQKRQAPLAMQPIPTWRS